MKLRTWSWVLAAATFGCACSYDAGDYSADDTNVVAAAQPLIGPDDNLDDFPFWIWPYIRPAKIYFKYLDGQIKAEVAQKAMLAAVEDCACALGSRKASPAEVLAAVDMVFSTQLTAARLAPHAVKGAESFQASAAFDDEWRCGNGLFPKWPRPRAIDELLKLQGGELINAIKAHVKLDRASTAALEKRVDQHVAEITEQVGRAN
ncbi:MAG TPA: hypothetical protein VMF89_20785 [Polyangiales bacterium]|nr:hypothetical protein [Polyangiales bacterium]